MKKLQRIVGLVLVIVSIFAFALPAMAATTSVGGVNVRKGPGTGFARIGSQIAAGSSFTIKFMANGSTLNGSDDWYYVENINCACGSSSCNAPYAGYIHSSCITAPIQFIRDAPDSEFEAFGATTLRNGSYGLEVYNAQLVLWEAGCLGSKKDMSACDGVFGQQTADGVIAFQTKFYLNSADGLIGPETREALWDYCQDPDNYNILKYYGVE